MIISFFGHRKFFDKNVTVEMVIGEIEKIAKNNAVEFFLGDYGDFDVFACGCAKEYKKKHSLTKLCFVSPYQDEEYLKIRDAQERFDEIVCPDVSLEPKRFAIGKRNKWMVDNSDFIFFYVNAKYGGAYTTLKYAKAKGKLYSNFYKL